MPSKRGYHDSLIWILHNRAGGGGHPPRDVSQVAGWLMTRLLAYQFNLSVREVAGDLVELQAALDDDRPLDEVEGVSDKGG